MTILFGIDVGTPMRTWFDLNLVPEVVKKYGDKPFFLAILDEAVPGDWRDPLRTVAFQASYNPSDEHDPEVIIGSEGLRQNVAGKLHFTLRTLRPSRDMRLRPDLVRPGDFPHAGAKIYLDYPGGVSGFKEESDEWVLERAIDHWVEVLGHAAQQAIVASKNKVPGWKYLNGVFQPDSGPDEKLETDNFASPPWIADS